MAFNKNAILKFKYKNYKEQISNREVLPMDIKYTKTQYHPEEQWFLDAYDVVKKKRRLFAIIDIIEFYK